MNENFPAKTVGISTRDPPWMTPLAKSLLKKKAMAKCRSPDGRPINLKERINAIVTKNRKSLACGKMGSKAWWKKVDALSKRKERSNPSFDEDSVRELKSVKGSGNSTFLEKDQLFYLKRAEKLSISIYFS